MVETERGEAWRDEKRIETERRVGIETGGDEKGKEEKIDKKKNKWWQKGK